MEKLLTTKTLAAALGASESSLRRWADSGAIRTTRTVGGHRRVALSEAIRFIRSSGSTVLRPELLGLPMGSGSPGVSRGPESSEHKLRDMLERGDLDEATSLIMSGYVGGADCATLFDKLIQPAMEEIGKLWQHQDRGILTEHRATDACVQAVRQLRQLLPAVRRSAPVAVGGAPEGDPYVMPSLMAGTIFAEAGYRDVNFGSNTPLELLAAAANDRAAKLVWVSISIKATDAIRRSLRDLSDPLRQSGARLVVGGRYAAALVPHAQPHETVLSSMSELAAFARHLRGAAPPKRRKPPP